MTAYDNLKNEWPKYFLYQNRPVRIVKDFTHGKLIGMDWLDMPASPTKILDNGQLLNRIEYFELCLQLSKANTT